MRAPIHHILFVSRRSARRGAMVLAVLLGLWLFAFASHVHPADEHGAPHQGAHCSFCLALPGAAAAPTQVSLPGTGATHSRPAAFAAASITSETFAFYQSRAPPVLAA